MDILLQNQTLIEISCYDQDSDDFGGATKKVYELRDRLIYAIEFAGTLNNNEDGYIIPHIKLLEYSQDSKPTIGTIYLDKTGNAINEKFLIDPVTNQIKRYKLLIRFLYDEYTSPL